MQNATSFHQNNLIFYPTNSRAELQQHKAHATAGAERYCEEWWLSGKEVKRSAARCRLRKALKGNGAHNPSYIYT